MSHFTCRIAAIIKWGKTNGIYVVVFPNRVSMWQLETQLFASSFVWLAYIFKASYSTLATSVSKKSSVDQSEREK